MFCAMLFKKLESLFPNFTASYDLKVDAVGESYEEVNVFSFLFHLKDFQVNIEVGYTVWIQGHLRSYKVR